MLRILGSRRTLCDGVTRRDLLQVGGLGAFGLGLGDFLGQRARADQAGSATPTPARTFQSAKSCILLFPYGSPPQHETFDPKPEAPAEIQGEMKAIDTSVPGLKICEYLPRIAPIMDRVTVVRSVTHPYPVHGVAYATSGIPTYEPSLETNPRDPRLWPYIGSIVDYLDDQRAQGVVPSVPRNIGMPWVLDSKSDLVPLAGPYASFLGQAYDPVWAEFMGQPTQHAFAPKLSDKQTREYYDPYGGVQPDCRFAVSAGGELPADVSPDRLDLRRSLLSQFDQARRAMDASASSGDFGKYQEIAFSLVASPRVRDALDVSREPADSREAYGLTLFGQSCLAARRLVEAGCRFITVFWDCYGLFGGGAWDTHANHYPRLKEQLLPGFDRAYSALILDLEARGLLDETLVLWLSEHGRTPQIDSKPKGAGRHHWSRVYSVAMAGAGVARGRVVGESDKIGGDVKDTPVSPKDILASSFHLLGIDPKTTVPDRVGRPHLIAGEGEVRHELF